MAGALGVAVAIGVALANASRSNLTVRLHDTHTPLEESAS
jgi:hypothetical protein